MTPAIVETKLCEQCSARCGNKWKIGKPSRGPGHADALAKRMSKPVQAASTAPYARILELHAIGMRLTHIGAFLGIPYAAVSAVLDRRAH